MPVASADCIELYTISIIDNDIYPRNLLARGLRLHLYHCVLLCMAMQSFDVLAMPYR